MGSTQIGIELGSGAVRVLALRRARGGWRVTCFEERALPDPTGDARAEPFPELFPEAPIAAAVNDIFARHRLPRDNVAISVPAHRCVFRNFTVGFAASDQIRQIVKYEAEQHLPTVAIEDVVVNHYRVAGDEERTQLLVSVVDKHLVRAALKVAAACRVDPLSLDIDLMAALNTYRQTGLLDRPGRVLVLQVDEHATSISLTIDGQLQFVRSVKLGTAAVDRDQADLGADDPLAGLDPSAELDLGALEAELALAGPTLESAAHPALDPAPSERERLADRLLQQVRRTMLSARQAPPESIVLAGSGTQVLGLREALEEAYRVPVVLPPILERFACDGSARGLTSRDAARMPAALGLALKAGGLDEGGVELRRDEFRYSRTLDQLQGRLLLATGLLFAVVVVCCFQIRRALQAATLEFGQLDAQARELYVHATGEPPASALGNLDAAPPGRRLPTMLADLEERRGLLVADEGDQLGGLDLWREVSAVLGRIGTAPGSRLTLDHLRIDEHEVVLEGRVARQVDEQALWAALLALVREHEATFAAPRNDSAPREDGAVGFSYRLARKRDG